MTAADEALKGWRHEQSDTLAKIDRRRDLARAYNYREMEDCAFRAGYESALLSQPPSGGCPKCGKAMTLHCSPCDLKADLQRRVDNDWRDR